MSARRISRYVAVLTALALVAVPAASAGKGGGKPGGSTSGSSVRLVLMDGATEARYGGRITFEVSTSTDRPFVGVRCWQSATWVYDAYIGFFPDYMYDPWLTLGSHTWTPGVEATCTARLFWYDKRGNQNVLATTTFVAAP